MTRKHRILCCPRCGCRQLTPITDRNLSAAVASGIAVSAVSDRDTGILAAASSVKQKTYWLCSECGKRFRNPDELEEEIADGAKAGKIFFFCILIPMILLSLIIWLFEGTMMGLFMIVLSVLLSVLFAFGFNKLIDRFIIDKKRQELAEIDRSIEEISTIKE